MNLKKSGKIPKLDAKENNKQETKPKKPMKGLERPRQKNMVEGEDEDEEEEESNSISIREDNKKKGNKGKIKNNGKEKEKRGRSKEIKHSFIDEDEEESDFLFSNIEINQTNIKKENVNNDYFHDESFISAKK